MREALMTTNLPLPNRRAGKVRDLYDVRLPTGEPGVLIVATDRISAFDVVMANGLPGKGIVLTQLSKFWFEFFSGTVKHHLVSTEAADIPGLHDAERRSLAGRVMLCRKVDVVPIECIARGYITGSGWKDYQKTGSVCGIPLPKGLRNGDRLEKPLFTPSTKAASGHDENISFDEGAAVVGSELMRWLGDTTLDLYTRASAYALQRGIILADTKFEFGQIAGDGTPLLVDEIFTPDSSRFWPADQWRPGAEQPSFDKQYVRDYLETLVSARRWDKTPPGPPLPQEVVQNSLARYREAFERLTGAPIDLDRF
ncbi:MAG TPA: phosphoribosylaminoimidazolesuccinocarboxamide synthase [Pseudomonadales bacterium]